MPVKSSYGSDNLTISYSDMPVETVGDLARESARYADALVGVETEGPTEDYEDTPYSPDDIRITKGMFSVFEVNRWITKGILWLTPDFQRNLVWDSNRQSLLIESLMLGIPISDFYLQENKNKGKLVIDGLQRLSTIHLYMTDNFRLKGLQYLTQYEDYLYSELPVKYTSRIEDTQLAINILDEKCHELVKFDVFRRVNTGGIPLNQQEIRNVMATEGTRSLLKKMSSSQAFVRATRGRVRDVRMDAQELCLRFIAFYLRYDCKSGELRDQEALTKMLDKTVLVLNKMSESECQALFDAFRLSMCKCHALLGDSSFTKNPENYIINKPLFTSWSVIMANYDADIDTLAVRSRDAMRLQSKYLENIDYYNAVTSSTASRRNVEIQFENVRKILKELFND